MAVFEGKNKIKSDDSNIKINAKEYYGKIRVICEEFELSAALSVGDEILGPELPQGAKIVDAVVKSDDMGATGIFDLGIQENIEGVITKNVNGLVGIADAGGQSVLKRADKDSNLIGAEVAEGLNKETLPLITVTEATANAAGMIKIFIYLSVE